MSPPVHRRPDALPDPDDPQRVAAALEAACANPSLPSDLLELLSSARRALESVARDAEGADLRYRALFDAVPDPVSILDEQGIVLDLNTAGMVAYRRRHDEIVGQPIELLNPDLPKDHMQPVLETLRRGETYVIEVTNMRGDGSRFPVEVHSAGFLHDGRRCVVAVARDLSARREAELRYGQLLAVIDKGVLALDAEGHALQANAAAMRILGARPDDSLRDMLDPAIWTLLDESGRRIAFEDLPSQRTQRTGQPTKSTVIGMYHKPERRLRWLSVTTVPLFAPGGHAPYQVISLFSDVTRLKRDSALFSRAQALARIGGWEWEVGRDALYLTDEAIRILGQASPPATMEGLMLCLGIGDRVRLGEALRVAAEHSVPIDLELQGLRLDGRTLWIRIIGEAETDESANVSITGTVQDIKERKQAEESLRVQARTDPLTGLLNRDAILGEIGQRMDDPLQARLAVLYIDLDRFKMVNDGLGHAAGDQLLCHAAQRILSAVDEDGLVARFGGDEFLVLCQLEDDDTLPEQIAQRIVDAFDDSFHHGCEEFHVTASIGIALSPRDGDRPQPLIQNADAAMYDSKRRVRNGWLVYSPALKESREDRLRLETQLHRAVDKSEFHLVYQPQVSLRSGEIVAAEALIRWNNRQLGEMRPDHFIGHAENSGDIVRIGRWVLSEACKQVAAWRDAGHGVVRVAVNVSYRQFLGDDLVGSVRAILEEYNLPGNALELEFTERALIEDSADTLQAFAALRELGVMLTIDDFGEGYSALNYLRRLPIHGLKLSQLFVGGAPRDRSDVAVCQAIAGIARSLGLGLVAEGVESEAQRQFLLELGVRVGQGFLFAPGLMPTEFARRLAVGHRHARLAERISAVEPSS